MQMSCAGCGNIITQNSPPIRGLARDGSDGWLCSCCPAHVCVNCYANHTADSHPDMGVVKGKKRQKK